MTEELRLAHTLPLEFLGLYLLLAPGVQIGSWLDSEHYRTLVIRRETSP